MHKLFNSFLIKGFSLDAIGEIEKKIIYHYTSPETFLNIISEQSIRFSDIRFMNDNSEKIFFVKKLIEFCEENKKEYPKFCELVFGLLDGNNLDNIKRLQTKEIIYNKKTSISYKPERTFIFCASNTCDALNMWNYYVNNGKYEGYSIGVNIESLLRTFDVDDARQFNGFIVYYGDVLYDEKYQYSEIRRFAEEIEREIRLDGKFGLEISTLTILSYIDIHGAFYKSPAFKHENEFRILISIPDKNIPHNEQEAQKYYGNNNKRMIEKFSTKHGLIVPSLQVTLPQNAIARIYTAPMMEYKTAKESVKELLDNYGYKYDGKSVSIWQSKIPIRF